MRELRSALLLALGLSGCGTTGFAPDVIVEDPGAEAFLNVISRECGNRSIGDQPVNYLLDVNSDDTYFVDITSKLYFGDVSRRQYASDINAFYPGGTNQDALDCIFSELRG